MVKSNSCSYDGILATPVQDVLLLPDSFVETPPNWFLHIGGNPEQWLPFSRVVFKRLVEVYEQISARLKALCDHFGIDQSSSGWGRDLALSLAWRHEPWVFEGPHVRYADLCRKLDINPDAHTGDDLAMTLARRHVPAAKNK